MAETINEYLGASLVYGQTDCNLMMLSVYEEDKHDALKGHYKTAIGGARVAKKLFGYPHIKNYMAESELYEEITNPLMVVYGDIVVCKNNNATMLATGYDTAFFSDSEHDDTFRHSNIELDMTHHIVYRRL